MITIKARYLCGPVCKKDYQIRLGYGDLMMREKIKISKKFLLNEYITEKKQQEK